MSAEDYPTIHDVDWRQTAKIAAALGAVFLLGMWFGINYTASLVVETTLFTSQPPWKPQAELVIYATLAGVAMCTIGWVYLDYQEVVE